MNEQLYISYIFIFSCFDHLHAGICQRKGTRG